MSESLTENPGSCSTHYIVGLKYATGIMAKNTANHYWGTLLYIHYLVLSIYLIFIYHSNPGKQELLPQFTVQN